MSDASSQAEISKNLGNEYFKNKKYLEAIRHYTDAINLNPENAIYYSNRSACYALLSKWQQSMEDALVCVSKDNKFLKGFYRLATAQIELNLFDEAEQSIKACESIEPDNEQLPKLRKTLRTKRQQFSSTVSKKNVKQLDETQRKEFMELQDQLSNYNKENRMIQNRIASTQRESRTNQVTLDHVKSLQPEVKTYRAIGKTFLLTPKDKVEEFLQVEANALSKSYKDLLNHKEYLERQISSTTNNLKDLTVGL